MTSRRGSPTNGIRKDGTEQPFRSWNYEFVDSLSLVLQVASGPRRERASENEGKK